MPPLERGSMSALALLRLPQGGYVVADSCHHPWHGEDRGRMSQFYFASDDIESAFAFMRDAMKPIEIRHPTKAPWDSSPKPEYAEEQK